MDSRVVALSLYHINCPESVPRYDLCILISLSGPLNFVLLLIIGSAWLNDDEGADFPSTCTRAVLPCGRVAGYLRATGDRLSVRRLIVPTRTPNNQRNLLTK